MRFKTHLAYVLKKHGVWDSAVFIFLSDHGEEIGDHGGWLHGISVYDELVHVPLIVHFPNGKFAGMRIRKVVSLIDVMPTILDYLGRTGNCDDCRGTSLLPLLGAAESYEGDALTVPSVRTNETFYYRPWADSRGNTNVVIRKGAWKGIWTDDVGRFELFDLDQDPSEQLDVGLQQPALSSALKNAGRKVLEICRGNQQPVEESMELDDHTRQRLEALGYFE